MSAEREALSGGAVVVDPLGGLVLDPAHELRFKGPFDDYVNVTLSIKNPTEKRVAFKIKTTAPKRYCVKPNSGVLDSNQFMKVNVLLQPFNYDPNEKNKHKFMVQYLYLNDEEIQMSVNDILNMWKDVSPSRLLDMKLRCIFEFTEAEQLRLSQQQQYNDSQQPSTTSTTSSANHPDSNKQPAQVAQSKAEGGAAVAPVAPVAPSSGSKNQATTKQTNDPLSPAADSNSNDFVSDQTVYFSSKANINNKIDKLSGLGARQDKNDNTINELKLENEILKKENARLKNEEERLRKMLISYQTPGQASSSSRSNQQSLEFNSLSDLLNNRLIIIIILLVSIIVYLLLFR